MISDDDEDDWITWFVMVLTERSVLPIMSHLSRNLVVARSVWKHEE